MPLLTPRLGGMLRRFRPAPRPLSAGGRFTYIDALRGFAALWVLLYHFVGRLTDDFAVTCLPAPLQSFVHHGWLGVEVFFVLSGFVIAYSLRDARVTPGYLARFALRRSLRLDPPYWVTIFLAYGMLRLGGAVLVPAGGDGTALLVNLLYLDRVVGVPSAVSVGWTLCLEIQLYLTYILLLALSQRLASWAGEGKARLLVFGPVAAWSLAVGFDAAAAPWRGLCVGYWYMFFLGVLTAWLVCGQLSLRGFVLSCLGVGLATVLHWDVRAAAAVAVALSIVLVAGFGRLHTLLDWGWLQYLGRMSYSLYLTHTVVGWPLIALGLAWSGGRPGVLGSVALFTAAVGASFAAAALLHRWVEAPSLALGRRVVLRGAPHQWSSP